MRSTATRSSRPSLLGAGTPAEDHHVAPSHPEYAALPKYPRDIDKAKKLLADAGYPDGFEFDMVTRPDPIWELNTAQVLAEQFKDIGVKINIKSLPSAQYWEVWTDGAVQPDRLGPPAAGHHDAVACLSLECGLEQIALLQCRVRPAAHPGRGHSRPQGTQQGHGEDRSDHAGGRADRSALLARLLDRHGQEGRGLRAASFAVYLRASIRDLRPKSGRSRPRRGLGGADGRSDPCRHGEIPAQSFGDDAADHARAPRSWSSRSASSRPAAWRANRSARSRRSNRSTC